MLALPFLAFGCGPKAAVENKLLDPPEIPAELPPQWTSFAIPPNQYRVSIADKGPAGQRCIEIEGDGERGGVLLNSVPIARDHAYRFEGWMEVAGSPEADATIKLDWIKANGDPVTASAGRIAPKDKGWQRIALQVSSADKPEDATMLRVALMLAGKGAARFTDVNLRQLPQSGKSPPNLLVNGDLESVVGPRLPGWQLVHSKKTKVAMDVSEERPHAGRLCAHLKGGGEWAVLTSQRLDVDAGKKYLLRGYSRRTVGKAMLKIDLYRDKELVRSETSKSATLDEWEPLDVTVSPTQLTGIDQIAVGMVVRGTEVEAWFDDVSLQAANP